MNRISIRLLSLLSLFILIAFFLVFETSSFVKYSHEGKTRKADEWESLNFEFCKMLSNAKFDKDVYINAFRGTINEVSPPPSVFVKLIDTSAKNFHDYFNRQHSELDYESSKRHACYSAVSGRLLESTGVSNGPCNFYF